MYSIYAGDELLYSDVYPLETRKVTSPTLKMGVDEAGSLEFTVSEVNKCYTKLLRMKTIITVKKLNPITHAEEPIWDGRILREDRDFYKNKKMYVEGALAFLNDSCQPLKEYANKDLEALVTAIFDEHNKIVKDDSRKLYWGGIADDFKPHQIEYWSTQYEYTIDTIKSIASYLECHFIIKKNAENGHNEIWFFKNQCGVSNQSIVFAKNLMDYTENYDLSKLATVLLPLCKTDRETSDKPINVGTVIDLTQPKPCGEDGWGVFCPLSTGWAQIWSPSTDKQVNKGATHVYHGGDFNASKYDNFHITIAPDISAVDQLNNILVGDLDSDGNVDTSFSLKRLITEIIPLGTDSPNEDAGVDGSSFHAYQFVIEDNANIYNRASQIKAYLYYRLKNSSDSWTLFKRNDTEVCSGWGLYNDDSGMRWPNTWNEDPARLAFEVYAPSGSDRAVPDTTTYEWAVRISFSLPEDATWDDTATHFRNRIKFAKLFAIAGVRYTSQTGVRWIDETGTYTNEVDYLVNKTQNTGLYSTYVLNLKRCASDNQTYYGRPWAFSAYPLARYNPNENGGSGGYDIYVTNETKIFTGDISVRSAVHGGSRDITDVDLLRFTRDPIPNVQDRSLESLGFWNFGTTGATYETLQSLNYGWLKYNPRDNNSRIVVLEIDLDKYSSYFLTTTNSSAPIQGDIKCVATVWKIKNDPNIPDWIPLKGRDTDTDDGFEYHLITNGDVEGTYKPLLSLSVNRSGSNSRMTHEDLEEDNPTTLYVLNPAKYEYVSSDQATKRCFEKEMHLYYKPDEYHSHHILLCLYSDNSDLSVTLATDEELYSVLAIGQDPNGIDKSKETPARHGTEEPHSYIDPDNVYDDKLGYGTIVPPTDEYRLPTLSELTAMENANVSNIEKPFPNVWGEGGYYGPHASAPFNLTAPFNTIGIVKSSSLYDTNFKTCVFFVKPSYVDETGKLCTRSIYLSTTMHGMSAMYVIFELSNADRSAAKWTDQWVPKCRAVEYGKYINGYTTYNKKKITLPTCQDKDALLEVFVASYGTEPSIWLHDPELANKASYLTIGAANNGEIRLYADQINEFTSSIEQGGLNDQNGIVNEPPSLTRVRTRDFMTVKSTGAYALTYSSEYSVFAKIYVYSNDETFKYSIDFSEPNPVILLSNVIQGDKIKVEFKIGPTSSGILPNDVKYLQLYSLNSNALTNLSQGPLKAHVVGENIDIDADPTDLNANMFVSTTDYYVAKSTDKVALFVAPGSIPTTIEVDGETKDVISSQFYLKIYYQIPNNSNTYSIVYNGQVYQTSESLGTITFTPPVVDARFKVQLRIQVGYVNGDQIIYVNAPITPQTVGSIILTPLIKQDYYPPSNALETYGRIEKRIEFEDAESSQELLERAQKYLRQSQFDEMQLKVKALDMTLMGVSVDNLHIGDKINVSSPPHGLYRDFIIREMSIPFDKPENTTFELGWDNKDSLAKLIRKEKSKW